MILIPVFSMPLCLRGRFFLPCGKWQQGNVACPLNGRGQAALVRRAYSGQPAWDNLAPVPPQTGFQQAHVFVIDVVQSSPRRICRPSCAGKNLRPPSRPPRHCTIRAGPDLVCRRCVAVALGLILLGFRQPYVASFKPARS